MRLAATQKRGERAPERGRGGQGMLPTGDESGYTGQGLRRCPGGPPAGPPARGRARGGGSPAGPAGAGGRLRAGRRVASVRGGALPRLRSAAALRAACMGLRYAVALERERRQRRAGRERAEEGTVRQGRTCAAAGRAANVGGRCSGGGNRQLRAPRGVSSIPLMAALGMARGRGAGRGRPAPRAGCTRCHGAAEGHCCC